MSTFNCLVCDTPIEVLFDDDRDKLDDGASCGECHLIYNFSSNQTVVDGKLCGAGGQMKYDFNIKQINPLPRK